MRAHRRISNPRLSTLIPDSAAEAGANRNKRAVIGSHRVWHRGAIPVKIRAVARCHLKSPHAGTNRAASVVSLRGSRKETVLHVNGVAGCIRGRPKSQNNADQTQRERSCFYVGL